MHFRDNKKLVCYLQFSLINGATRKLLSNLFRILQYAQTKDRTVIVYWVVEEDDEVIKDFGQDLQSTVDFEFRFTAP